MDEVEGEYKVGRGKPPLHTGFKNTFEKIIDRIDNRCQKLTKQLPNFIGVDFFQLPDSYSKAGGCGGRDKQKVC